MQPGQARKNGLGRKTKQFLIMEGLGLRVALVQGVIKYSALDIAARTCTEVHDSARNSYSSITAATGTFESARPLSTRTTLPLQRTRMLSVRVISGGRVRVNSIAEPALMGASR